MNSSAVFEISKEVTFRAMRVLKEQAALHGHEFRLRLSLRGELDMRSGLVFERDRLDRILKLAVIDPLDGQNLCEFFPNPSNEGLARALYLRLRPLFPEEMLTCVSISTPGVSATYPVIA